MPTLENQTFEEIRIGQKAGYEKTLTEGAAISAALALKLPGPGAIYLGQTLSFRAPVLIGDTVTVELEVTDKRQEKHVVTIACTARNQKGKVIASGEAQVMAPTEKVRIEAPELPEITAL